MEANQKIELSTGTMAKILVEIGAEYIHEDSPEEGCCSFSVDHNSYYMNCQRGRLVVFKSHSMFAATYCALELEDPNMVDALRRITHDPRDGSWIFDY